MQHNTHSAQGKREEHGARSYRIASATCGVRTSEGRPAQCRRLDISRDRCRTCEGSACTLNRCKGDMQLQRREMLHEGCVRTGSVSWVRMRTKFRRRAHGQVLTMAAVWVVRAVTEYVVRNVLDRGPVELRGGGACRPSRSPIGGDLCRGVRHSTSRTRLRCCKCTAGCNEQS